MAFLNVPSLRSSANSIHTSNPAMKNKRLNDEMRLLNENRTVAYGKFGSEAPTLTSSRFAASTRAHSTPVNT